MKGTARLAVANLAAWPGFDDTIWFPLRRSSIASESAATPTRGSYRRPGATILPDSHTTPHREPTMPSIFLVDQDPDI
jgi:hypothetical protein